MPHLKPTDMPRLTVAKFGGSALGADGVFIPRIVERICELGRLGGDGNTKVIAVFSAPLTTHNGIKRSLTDIMLELGRGAATATAASTATAVYDAKNQDGTTIAMDTISKTYEKILQEHIGRGGPHYNPCKDAIQENLSRAQQALDEARSKESFAGEIRSRALGFSGEIPMSHIMKHILLHNGIKADSIKFEDWPIITDDNIESSNFMVSESKKHMKAIQRAVEENDVVTIGGFIGKTRDGVTTTYERGGTDRTAVDLGILFHKTHNTSIDFEKDSAVVSADPKIIRDGLSEVDQMSYNEARLAGMFGMKILDPVAIKEVVENGVDMPIIITNLNEPQKTTTIKRMPDENRAANPIKMVTGKSNCAIFRIEAMAAQRLLGSLEKDRRYSEFVILSPYTKDSIEFSRILFLDADYMRSNEKYFMSFDSLATITYGRGVITLIGDEMWRVQQVASRTSACVGQSGLNILNMDAQEETSRIIIVIEDAQDNVARAIASIHDEIRLINEDATKTAS